MSNKSKHTPGPLEAHQTTLLGAPCISLTTGKLFPSFICHVEGEDREANAKLFIAAPDLLKEIEATNAFALELMERAAKIDRMLLEAKGQPLECELGEVVRLRQQLGRNRAAIAKATA